MNGNKRLDLCECVCIVGIYARAREIWKFYFMFLLTKLRTHSHIWIKWINDNNNIIFNSFFLFIRRNMNKIVPMDTAHTHTRSHSDMEEETWNTRTHMLHLAQWNLIIIIIVLISLYLISSIHTSIPPSLSLSAASSYIFRLCLC